MSLHHTVNRKNLSALPEGTVIRVVMPTGEDARRIVLRAEDIPVLVELLHGRFFTVEREPQQCPEASPDPRKQCGLPAGHAGPHTVAGFKARKPVVLCAVCGKPCGDSYTWTFGRPHCGQDCATVTINERSGRSPSFRKPSGNGAMEAVDFATTLKLATAPEAVTPPREVERVVVDIPEHGFHLELAMPLARKVLSKLLARVPEPWAEPPRRPWMHGDPRPCELCGRDGTWHALGNNNVSGCRGYSPRERPAGG